MSDVIETRSKHMQMTQSAGKHVRTSYNRFWFYFRLDEKAASVFF